jgi:hypothetical protein
MQGLFGRIPPEEPIDGDRALLMLLANEDLLSNETYEFCISCAGFAKLSEGQAKALINTWKRVEAVKLAKQNRRQRCKRRDRF